MPELHSLNLMPTFERCSILRGQLGEVMKAKIKMGVVDLLELKRRK